MNFMAWFEPEFCLRLTQTLLHFLWQGLAIAAIVMLVGYGMRGASANLRYTIHVGALLLMAACLPVTFVLVKVPLLDVAKNESTPSGVTIADSTANGLESLPTNEPPDSPDGTLPLPTVLKDHSPAKHSTATTTALEPTEGSETTLVTQLAVYATAIYLMGLAAMLLKFAVGLWGGQRLRTSSTPVSDTNVLAMLRRQAKQLRLRVIPAIATCHRISVPIVIGVVKPVILLPAALATSLSPQQLEALLTHEIAHIRRYDLLVNLLQRLIESVLFFHPVVWYVSRKVSIERELACDDFVVSSGWRKSDYAAALVRMAELCVASPPASAGVLAASGNRPSQFKLRIQRLVNTAEDSRLRLSRVGVLLLLCFLTIAVLTPAVVHSWAQAPIENGDSGHSDAKGGEKRVNRKKKSDHVDRYGDPLPDGAISRAGTLRMRHGGSVGRVAFSPDGKRILSWGSGAFRFWDAKTGENIRQHSLPHTRLEVFANFADGNALAVFHSSDDEIHLWNYAKDEPPKIGVGPEFGEVAVGDDQESFGRFAIRSDGQILAGATSGLTERRRLIQLWKFEHGKALDHLEKLREFPREVGDVRWLGFTQDGSKLVAISRERGSHGESIDELRTIEERTGHVFEVDSGKELLRFEMTEETGQGSNRAVDLSPMGSFMAVGCPDKSIYIYDLATGKQVHQFKCADVVHSLAYSSTGESLISAGRDSVATLWDVRSGKRRQQFVGHRSWIETVAIAPDGKTIATGSQDGTVRQWNIESGKQTHDFESHDYWIMATALSADGKLLVTGGFDGLVQFWEAETGKRLRKMKWDDFVVTSLALSPDEKTLAVGGMKRRKCLLRLFNVESGELIRQYDGQQEVGFNSLVFSPDGRRLIAGEGRKQNVRIWDTETSRQVRELKHDKPRVECIAISPDGKIIASSAESNNAASSEVRLWNAQSGELLREIKPEKGNVSAIAFSPDGQQIATAGHSTSHGFIAGRNIASNGFEDSLQIWDMATGELIAKFAGKPYKRGTRQINDVAFTPDGLFLVSAERNGTIVFHDMMTHRPLATLKHGGPVRGIRFSEDGSRLASISSDSTALVWEVRTILQKNKQKTTSPNRNKVGKAPESSALETNKAPESSAKQLALRAHGKAAAIDRLPRFYIRASARTFAELQFDKPADDPLRNLWCALEEPVAEEDRFRYVPTFARDEKHFLIGSHRSRILLSSVDRKVTDRIAKSLRWFATCPYHGCCSALTADKTRRRVRYSNCRQVSPSALQIVRFCFVPACGPSAQRSVSLTTNSPGGR